MSLTLIAVT